MRTLVRVWGLGAGLCILVSGAAVAQSTTEKAEIAIENDYGEAVTMRFDYAFRDRRWNLMTHRIEAGDDILYRFPSNIPGCEKLREWHITDGVLSIDNAKGLFCDIRISLCDKQAMRMSVQKDKCLWARE